MSNKMVAIAASTLEGQARTDFMILPSARQYIVAKAILSNMDGRGRGLEVTTPPYRGNSRRYRWGR